MVKIIVVIIIRSRTRTRRARTIRTRIYICRYCLPKGNNRNK